MTDGVPEISSNRIDRAGVVSSTVCAVHCASAAAAPSLIAALGLSVLVGPMFEWGFTVLAVLLGASALVIGWRRHQTMSVALVLGAGILGLLLGRVLEMNEFHGAGTVVSVVAGVALVVGHLSGIRASRAQAEAGS
ncbi:MAG: MerC domain-containing protein [Myxococcota bacterium]